MVSLNDDNPLSNHTIYSQTKFKSSYFTLITMPDPGAMRVFWYLFAGFRGRY